MHLPIPTAEKVPVKVSSGTGAPASSSTVVPSAAAVSPMREMSGSVTPRSHLDTVCKWTPNASASCVCVKPFLFRNSLSRSAKVIGASYRGIPRAPRARARHILNI